MNKLAITKEEFLKLQPTSRIEYLNRGDRWVQKLMPIVGSVPKDLKGKFGSPSFIFSSKRMEWKLSNWAFEFEGEKYFIATANERGATIESTSTNPKQAERFIDELLKMF